MSKNYKSINKTHSHTRLHSILTEVAEEGTQEWLSRSRYQNPAEKVQVRLPLTGGQVSSQISGYFVGDIWIRIRFLKMREQKCKKQFRLKMKMVEISIDITLAPITNTTYSRPLVYKERHSTKSKALLIRIIESFFKMAGWLVMNNSFNTERLQYTA